MAPRNSHLGRSMRQNSLKGDCVEDGFLTGAQDLAEVQSPTEIASSADSSTPAIERSCGHTATLAPALAMVNSTEDFLKEFIKDFLEFPKTGVQRPTEPCKQPLKRRFLDLYLAMIHMNSYHFGQHSKDNFDNARATDANRTSFRPSFFCRSISIRWTKYKRCHRIKKSKPAFILWDDLKSFCGQAWATSGSFWWSSGERSKNILCTSLVRFKTESLILNIYYSFLLILTAIRFRRGLTWSDTSRKP